MNYNEATKILLEWYKHYGRHDLPWRQSRDPYRVYVSEVMLQQTQVERVLGYYQRFIERWPSLQALALAKEEEVLALWSGLGYYSRARNLLKSAQLCAATGLPRSYEELLRLPGIGRYTASAICAFAYDQPVVVIDTNIKRVLRRYFATTKDNGLWDLAKTILDTKHPREHNLALMDLGALVCTPTAPQCHECPLHPTCQGHEDPLAYSAPKPKAYEKLQLFLGLCIQDGRLALIPSTQRLYQGLLVLPPTTPDPTRYIATITHTYTRYRIKAHLYHTDPPREATWIPLNALDEAPISSLTKKAVAKFIQS
ncbi:MAG: A/G-specific adenine glycosylase [Epsilonproteobacteria bacterium]|nr:A/G-specific adenine glycosylase [Campylobacterota bacterium]